MVSFPLQTLTAFRLDRYVALKIATSESDHAGQELEILKHISIEIQQHPGRSYVVTLLDSFEHRGPNGIHECFIFEVMGSSLESYIIDSISKTAPLDFSSNSPQKPFKHDLLEIKSILRQMLYGIDFLHDCGIAHSDLEPGNILLSINDLSSVEESRLAQYDENGAHFVAVADKFVRTYKDDWPSIAVESGPPRTKRQKTSHDVENDYSAKESSQDDHKPRYPALKRPLDEVAELASPPRVKISDMGGAFFSSNPPGKPTTPLNMRSPELILGHPISQNQDMWSFGCLVFELITSRPLFTEFPLAFDKDLNSSDDDDFHTENEDNGKDVMNRNENNIESGREAEGDVDPEHQEDDTDREGTKSHHPAIPHSQEDEDAPSADDDHLQQLACILRPLPPTILSQWPRASNLFEQNGKAKYDKGDDAPPYQSLEEIFDHEKPIDVNATERVAALDLIRFILQYEPEERPSASQLLKHPWFAEADGKD